jgi:hypothetical protein
MMDETQGSATIAATLTINMMNFPTPRISECADDTTKNASRKPASINPVATIEPKTLPTVRTYNQLVVVKLDNMQLFDNSAIGHSAVISAVRQICPICSATRCATKTPFVYHAAALRALR